MRTAIDRALAQLREILQGDSEEALKRLRAVIDEQTGSAAFNERRVVREIEKLQSRGTLTVQDIDYLAERIRAEGVP
jgi:hypothetical protein